MRKHPQIRLKAHHHAPCLFESGEALSREQALSQIRGLLSGSRLHAQALRLIDLFQIEAEELAEAGVSFEMLKALERKRLF